MPKITRQKNTTPIIANKAEALKMRSQKERHKNYVMNAEYFQIARALYDSCTASNETLTLTEAQRIQRGLLRLAVHEYCEMYETYIGDYDDREPRFDHEYLFHIELPVLKFFLPYLRRADLFNEQGAPTPLSVSKSSISAMIHPRGDKETWECVDLASLFVAKIERVMAPFGEYLIEMSASPNPEVLFEFMDDPTGKVPLVDVECGTLAPKYDDISKRYYARFGPQNPSSLN